jgi:asparagine synthase (glutamine-hydrolysing)
MCNEDGTVWITFNGEIYNYVELAARLKHRGHRFRSQTDTEVIVHLYEELGERCVDELNGMFGFAIWDSRKNQLFGARDRLGIKPFYYYLDYRQFVCASEIKAILEDDNVPRRPDFRGIADFHFAGAPLAGKTMFAGIHELPPGHRIVVKEGKARIGKYWDVTYDYQNTRSTHTLSSELSELLDDAVRIRCRSDAPVGCHLSGGLDSSTVVGLAAKYLNPLKTFSIKFDGGSYYDETGHAKLVADFVGAEYLEMAGLEKDLSSLYTPLMWHMDQPPAGGGDVGFSYYNAARLAAKHVKVTLTGHGGDEVFGGYGAQFQTAFGTSNVACGAPHTAPPRLSERILTVLKREGLRGAADRITRLVKRKAVTDEQRWTSLHCGVLPAQDIALHHDFRAQLADYSPQDDYVRPFREAPTNRLFDRCLYHDLRVYLPQLLHKEDRASMAVSIESRVPLVDYRIVEFMATVPPEQKVPGFVPKGLLRQAAASWLPQSIAKRKDKAPFPVPLESWLRGSLQTLHRSLLSSSRCLDRGIFNPDLIRGGQLTHSETVSMMNVELWFRMFIDRDPALLARRGLTAVTRLLLTVATNLCVIENCLLEYFWAVV